MSKKSIDDILAEIGAQVDRIASVKGDPLVPQSIITDYTRQFEELFIQGQNALRDYDRTNAALVEKLDYLVMLFEDDIEKCREVTSLRDSIFGEHEQYIGIIKKKRHADAQIITCLFADQATVPFPSVTQSVSKKVD